MSFLKNLGSMLQSGKLPNAKSLSKLASASLSGKNDSPFARKEITDDMLSPLQLHISRMHWDWREAGQSYNKGNGCAVKNWETNNATDPLYLTWQTPAQALTEYLVVIAWAGWATALIMRDSDKFRPEYVDALMGDKLGTVRIASAPAAAVETNALRLPASERNSFQYIKLIGKTDRGDYVEIADYQLSSAARRQENDKLTAAPDGEIYDLDLPQGSREQNEFEKSFKSGI